MKKVSGKQLFLLGVCVVVLIFSMTQISAVGNHLQYLVPAPSMSQGQWDGGSDGSSASTLPNQTLKDWLFSLKDRSSDWSGIIRFWSMDGIVQQASFGTDDSGALGKLTLLGEGGQILNPLYLLSGRLFYPDELQNGCDGIVLDEQTALSLFRESAPIGRSVSVGGKTFRVIGIVRHSKKVGDLTDSGAYIPLSSAFDMYMQLDAVLLQGKPVKGAGASVSFKSLAQGWQSGGTFIDLGKESMGAWLWLRVLLFLCGILLVLRVIAYLSTSVVYFSRQVKQRLQLAYALRLSPWIVWRVLLYILGFGLAIGAAALLVQFMLEPVYTFPEWIPAVLVEWSDINTTFWSVWQNSATLVELRSPELLRLRFFTLLVDGFSALAGVLLGMMYARWIGATRRVAENLEALYRQGVAVDIVQTQKPIPFADIGYAECIQRTLIATHRKKETAVVTMVRVINVVRTFEMLPPSPMDGSFVLEVEDAQIPANCGRWLISCQNGKTTIEEAKRDWDIRLPVQTLTRILYGKQSFHDFTENNAGLDMRMHSPAMDGLFNHAPLVDTDMR